MDGRICSTKKYTVLLLFNDSHFVILINKSQRHSSPLWQLCDWQGSVNVLVYTTQLTDLTNNFFPSAICKPNEPLIPVWQVHGIAVHLGTAGHFLIFEM